MINMIDVRRLTVCEVVAGAAVVLIASPASALLEVNGSQTCGTGYTPMLEVHYYGHEHDRGPGETSYVHRDAHEYWAWSSNGGPGGSWRGFIPVGDYGGFDNATYSHCVI